MNNGRLLLCVALFAFAAVGPRAAETATPVDAPDSAWREGPIRYILLVKEDQAYKALKTDEERAVFIESFWAALDPTPGTPENERRVEFWRRIEEADRLFREGAQPGWRTDRGKFFLLLGPPDGRNNRVIEEVWKYVALPNPGADPEVTIRFRRNSEGAYRVGRTTLEYWDPSQESDGPAAGDTFLAVRTKSGAMEMMRGRIRMTEFPLAAVMTDFVTAPLECSLRYDFYRAGPDATRVVLTLAVPKDQLRGEDGGFQAPDMSFSVAVDDARHGKPVGSYSEPMRIASGATTLMDRPLVYQGSFTIEPGTYRATVTIIDRKSHRGLTRTETLEAPEFGRRLALSSIAVGRLRDEPRAAGSGGDPGGASLVPEPDTVLRPGETVLFAYEVYNAERKHGAAPDLDVTYEFFLDLEGGPRPVGKPLVLRHQASEWLAYSLPLTGWPAASFRARIRVLDNRNGAKAEGEASFRVEAETAGTP